MLTLNALDRAERDDVLAQGTLFFSQLDQFFFWGRDLAILSIDMLC